MSRLTLALLVLLCICIQNCSSGSKFSFKEIVERILPNNKDKASTQPNGKTAADSSNAFQPIDYQLLSGHSPKRTTQCEDKRTCRFQCLGGKCENEEVVINDETSGVQLQCNKGERACLGHILLRGKKYSNNQEDKYNGRKAVVDCDFMTMKSCQGSEIKFSDIHTQILNGDVRESDILFQNADKAIININDEPSPEMYSVFRDQQGEELRMRHISQFNMNEVFTRNVNTFELNANADHSAVGSIFDLSGVKKKFAIRCKGTASCDGSLFIFDRCVHQQYEKSIIYCWPNACNDISIWVLHETRKNRAGKVVPQCQAKTEILYTSAAVMIKVWDDEKEQLRLRQSSTQAQGQAARQKAPAGGGKKPAQSPKRNIFILEHKNINNINTLSQDANPFMSNFGIELPEMRVVPFVQMPPPFEEVFTVLRSGTRQEWWKQIRDEEARVVQHFDIDAVQDRNIKHAWIPEQEGLSFFGAMYASQMTWTLASSSQTSVFWISSALLHHTITRAALLTCMKPLLPAIVLGTLWNAVYHGGGLKDNADRYKMMQSRLIGPNSEEQQASEKIRSNSQKQKQSKKSKSGNAVTKTRKSSSVVSYEWMLNYVILAVIVALVICVGFVVGFGGGLLTAYKQHQTEVEVEVEDDMV
eukprot:CAMPEP_0202726778 /NCGR_PEP_ID=MMETSP1385-20130828/184785_1 /ASSEMBLY_ACC=CAM_ASM_000861 /TAXON_ID=933848 /ORGANISM="Elphidium margaritaceum" /LENGTH=642 /DNA_ID=CAMNT_0049393005 /DNA_START=27 /DNA_END=1955 /DNA_ORIENTATION=+